MGWGQSEAWAWAGSLAVAEAWAGSLAVAKGRAGSLAVAEAKVWAEAWAGTPGPDFREPGRGRACRFLGRGTLKASQVPQKGDI